MKKIFALFVAGVFAFSVIGCGGSSTTPTVAPPKDTSKMGTAGTAGK